ncbi:hypothetical protein T265_04705 [Opisthorchis viverrini]|uniref:Uncharacterized protein n=1 Tax=Opisthorchis viverrini TaxID=6198 RepID=A0A074ZRM4_OPIVI|nr:hypothetical protein T265_04705 [Opisthorchis viverrini]KER28482.1 hypothetical protein T265_04705 [Opisthorchis viverrini]
MCGSFCDLAISTKAYSSRLGEWSSVQPRTNVTKTCYSGTSLSCTARYHNLGRSEPPYVCVLFIVVKLN